MLAGGLLDKKSSHDEAGVDADIDGSSPGGATRTKNNQLCTRWNENWEKGGDVPGSSLPPGMLPWTG